MALRDLIGRLERSASGELESFKLTDGSTYFYDRVAAYRELFLYAYDVELGDADKWDQPPEVLQRICEAQDPAAVLARFEPKDFMNLPEVVDVDVLVRERRLVLRSG
jgi:hypothetical protein